MSEKQPEKGLVQLVRDTYVNWRNDRTLRIGAGLSYYVVFSLIPTLAIAIFFASFLFPKEEVIEYMTERAIDLFGTTATEVVEYLSQQQLLESVTESLSELGLFGLVSLVVTASFAMIALMDSVNIIWGRPVAKGWRNVARRYIFSYVAVLSFALFLIMVLVVQALLSFMEEALDLEGPVFSFLTSAFTMSLVWGLFIIALAWLIRILSGKRVEWFYTIIGSVVTVLFMYIGVKAIGFYLSTFSLQSVTNAFGAVFLILLWVYYESQILLAGFQLTKTMSEKKYFSSLKARLLMLKLS